MRPGDGPIEPPPPLPTKSSTQPQTPTSLQRSFVRLKPPLIAWRQHLEGPPGFHGRSAWLTLARWQTPLCSLRLQVLLQQLIGGSEIHASRMLKTSSEHLQHVPARGLGGGGAVSFPKVFHAFSFRFVPRTGKAILPCRWWALLLPPQQNAHQKESKTNSPMPRLCASSFANGRLQ